jgi:hypothetical protein
LANTPQRSPPHSQDEHPVVISLKLSHVLCLKPLWASDDIELHALPFLQAADAAALNGREMYKNVFPILTGDEAVAFGVVKPLTVPVSIDVPVSI